MSKVDAQRALRDARFAAYREKVAAAAAAPAAKPAKAAESRSRAQPTAAAAPVETSPSSGTSGQVAQAEPVLVLDGEQSPVADLSVVTDDQPAAAAPALCGHRNMGNKSCQRPAGHAEKSHRYK